MIQPEYKRLLYAIVGITLTMFAVPELLASGGSVGIYAIGVYIFWMILTGKVGYSFVIMSLGLCIPLVSGNSVAIEAWNGNTVHIYNVLRISIIAALLYQLHHKGRIRYRLPLFIGLATVLLATGYDLHGVIGAINFFIYMHLFFVVVRNEWLAFDQGFMLLALIFCILALYAVLEYHFQICPYEAIYRRSIRYGWELINIPRAKGILGHPLIMGGVTVAFQAMLLIRLYVTGKLHTGLELLCLYMGAINVSRTTAVVLIMEVLLFLWIQSTRGWLRRWVPIAVAGLMLYCVAGRYIDALVINYFSRFGESISHRVASYPTVLRMWLDHPLGVGPQNIFRIVGEYAGSGFLRNFYTLDNFYLTQIASYGVLAFIPIVNYLVYLLMAFLQRNEMRSLFRFMLLLFVPWCAIGFSFDIEVHANLCLLFYGLAGLLWSNAEVIHAKAKLELISRIIK